MSFVAKIEADIANFERGIDKAIKDTDKAEKSISKRIGEIGDSFVSVGKKATAFSAGIVAITTGVVAFAKSVGDASSDLTSMASTLDTSTDALQQYEFVAQQAGTSSDTFTRSTEALIRRLKDVDGEGGRTIEIIEGLGVALKNTDGSVRQTGQISDELIKSLAEMEDVSRRNILASQLFGRSWGNLSPLLDLGADAIEGLKQEATDLGIVLDRDALDASADFVIAVDKITSRLGALKDRIGIELVPLIEQNLLPLIEDYIIPSFERFTEFIGSLITRFNDLSPSIRSNVGIISGLTVALGPTILAIGSLMKAIPLLTAGFAALTGPIGLAITAIAGLTVVVVKNWDSITDYFTDGAGADLFNTISELFSTLKDTVISIFKAIKSTVEGIWDVFGESIINTFTTALNRILTVFDFFVDSMQNALNFWRSAFTGDIKGMLSAVGSQFSNIFESIKIIVFDALSDMSGRLASFFEFIKLQSASDRIQGFADTLSGLAETERENRRERKGADKDAKDYNETIEESVKITNANADAIKRTSDNLAEYVAVLATVPTMGVSDTGTTPIIDLSDPASKVRDFGEEVVLISQEVANMVGSTVDNMIGGLSDAIEGALSGGGNVVAEFGSFLLGTLGDLAIKLGTITLGIGKTITALLATMTNPLGTIGAGAALIALGIATKAAAGAIANAGRGGGSAIATQPTGGARMRQEYPTYGSSEFRGAYSDKKEVVEFKIGVGELTGLLEIDKEKRNRLR